jgi:Repeat of unknown function (DUF5907)
VTTIRLGVLHPTGTAADARSLGVLEFEATARRVVDGDVVLPAPFSVTLSATEDVTRELAPTTSEWVWKVLERVTGGANGWRYLAIPDSEAVLDYAALVEVDPATLDPSAVPEAAWWAALAAGGGGGSSAPDATTSVKGLVKLAGDLAGTAAAPTVPGLAGKAPTVHTHAPGDVTGTAVVTSDARLSDARTPTAHAASHATGHTDAITPAAIGAQAAGSYAAALGTDDNYVTDAQLVVIGNTSGANTGDQTLPTWSTISGKPAVIGAGATAADARTAIGAGTSSFDGVYASLTSKPTLGSAAATASTDYATAAQGTDARTPTSHTQAASTISDSTTTGRAVVTATDAAAARTAIGAGTSSLALGTTSGTAKAGDYAPDLSGLVPTSRTVAGKALTGDITLAAADLTATGTKDATTYLRGDNTWNAPAGGGGSSSQVDIYYATGAAGSQSTYTWTKPTGAKTVDVFMLSGGGGGGSGRRGAAGSARVGGGGGSAGGWLAAPGITEAMLGATVAVKVGKGGTGGAAVTANDTSGNNGGGGGASTFGSLGHSAMAGNFAAGGGSGSGGGGGGAPAVTAGFGNAAFSLLAGGSASATGGGGGTGTSDGNREYNPSGGGGGGGVTAADSPSSGGHAFSGNVLGAVQVNGGGVSTNGGTGVRCPQHYFATGGSGGGGSITTTGGSGGAGGTYGGGGGGGGASLNGNNSGAGGVGGDGIVIIVTTF